MSGPARTITKVAVAGISVAIVGPTVTAAAVLGIILGGWWEYHRRLAEIEQDNDR